MNASLKNLHLIITLLFSKWRITQNMNHSSPNLTLLHQLEMLDHLYSEHAAQLTAQGLSRLQLLRNMPHLHTEMDLQTALLEMHALIRPGESFVAHLLEISPELRKAADTELSILEELREKIGASFTACARHSSAPINPEQIRSATERVLRAFMARESTNVR